MLRNKLRAMLLPQTENRIYLYNQGDTCDSITGGWNVVKNAKLNDTSMTVSHAEWGFRLTTNKPVDLTGKQLCIQVQRTDKHTSASYYLAFDISDEAVLNSAARYYILKDSNKELTIKKLNVKQGRSYIRIVSYFGAYRIDKIWLEDKESV